MLLCGQGVLLKDGDIFGDEELIYIPAEEVIQLFNLVVYLLPFLDLLHQLQDILRELEPFDLGLDHVELGGIQDLLVVLLEAVDI